MNTDKIFEIIYEDEYLIAVIKPYGISVSGSENSLEHLIKKYVGTDSYVAMVHRLDAVVGGLMVFAKTPESAASLSKQIVNFEMKKEYFVIVQGLPEEKEGELRDFLFKDSKKGKSFVVKRARKGVKEAVLDYKTLASFTDELNRDISLLRVKLKTGRTHQIRVQFSSRKHPVVGDGKYGSNINCDYIALWSCALSFRHPNSGAEMKFSVNPPELKPWNYFHYND